MVRRARPDTTLPTASLYSTHPGAASAYLIETGPRFTRGADTAASGDYTLKRLGDAWYEQELIKQQVLQPPSQRYLGGRISSRSEVALSARQDVNIIGGTVDAGDRLSLKAEGGIDICSTTTPSGLSTTTTVVDRVAGLYVSNPGGTLVAEAGGDPRIVGAVGLACAFRASALGQLPRIGGVLHFRLEPARR